MGNLRVLLVESDRGKSGQIVESLERASHAVLPTGGLAEATQALEVQRFDAIVVPSTCVNESLLAFRNSLNRFESPNRLTGRIPLVCYPSPDAEGLTAAELSRYQVDACLPEDFDGSDFTKLITALATKPGVLEGRNHREAEQLPVLLKEELQEQVGFDQELIAELVDLFLADSEDQLRSMRNGFDSGDLNAVSRVAHSIKGSLSSLHARQGAWWAHRLEQSAKAGRRQEAESDFAGLQISLERLKPLLLELRNG